MDWHIISVNTDKYYCCLCGQPIVLSKDHRCILGESNEGLADTDRFICFDCYDGITNMLEKYYYIK